MPGARTTFELPHGATMEFIWIPAGQFRMGASESQINELNQLYGTDWFSFEGPRHEVTITRGFWLGSYVVTQRQWERVMGTRPWEDEFGVEADPEHPAVYVSWDDVQDMVDKLNDHAGGQLYRLPTEAEWEYACRSGTDTRWSFGDDAALLGDYAWYWPGHPESRLEYAQRVGQKLPNPWGLFDMHGNVYEWVYDWISAFCTEAQEDPQGPSTGTLRAIRGGDFRTGTIGTRSTSRDHAPPDTRDNRIGFRLLRME